MPGLRNPHGNPSNGECPGLELGIQMVRYKVAYQEAMALVNATTERGEAALFYAAGRVTQVPVKAVGS